MSWTKNYRLRCDICQRIMSWHKPYYEWAPYGNYNDVEPPESEHAHQKCYEEYDEKWRDLIIRTSYLKPYLHIPEPQEAIFGRGYCPLCLRPKEDCDCFSLYNSEI